MSTDIETKLKNLQSRREAVKASKMKIEAELEARKRNLRSIMNECKEAGFDPDNVADEVTKLEEVIRVKLEVFEADLATAEAQIAPMMKEIE